MFPILYKVHIILLPSHPKDLVTPLYCFYSPFCTSSTLLLDLPTLKIWPHLFIVPVPYPVEGPLYSFNFKTSKILATSLYCVCPYRVHGPHYSYTFPLERPRKTSLRSFIASAPYHAQSPNDSFLHLPKKDFAARNFNFVLFNLLGH